MANTVTINIQTNAGAAGAQIQSVTAQIQTLGRASGQAGSVGRDALDGFAGGLGVPTSIAAATTAIAAGILLVSSNAIKAANDYTAATRVLKSDTKEAGLEFEKTKLEAQKFGDDLALSTAEAERSYGKFLRVLKAGGLLENRDKFTKDFENLTAAYGLTANEIETLTSQLLNGQDEALNKLGIADPSQLYKKYAESVGKTVEALTEEEKARARILAVTEKGSRFDGVQQEYLTSAPGQWAQLSAATSDASASLGKYIQNFRLYQYLVANSTSVLKNGYLAGAFMQGDLADNAAQEEKNRKYLENFKKFYAEQTKILDDNNPDKVAARKEAEANPFGSFNNRATLLGKDAAEKEKKNFETQYDALFKSKTLDKVTVDFAERQFRTIRGIFSGDKAAEYEKAFNKFWDKFAKVALGSLKTAREGADKFYDSATERGAGVNNPFVKVIIDANNRAEELRKTFGVLGNSSVRDLQKIEDSFTRQKLLSLELDAQLKASSLRREAIQLANPTGLSGQQERLLGELDARINSATNSPGLLAIANALGNGAVGRRSLTGEEYLERQYANRKGVNYDALTEEDKYRATRNRQDFIDRFDKKKDKFTNSGLRISQDEVARNAIDNLRDLENFGLKEGATFGTKAKAALNSALVNLFNSLSPELQASIATGGEGSSVLRSFREAFTGAAGDLQEKIKEEIAKQGVADRAVGAVREDISTIERLRKQGLSTSDADARLLATTGALDQKELTADIRQARIEALRREADRQINAQADATKATNEAKAATDKLTLSIDTLAGEIRKPTNRKLLIEINNRAKANVRDELYGSLQED